MFKLIKEQEIKALEMTFMEFEHEETKARHIHLKTDDKENAFVCALRSTSDNSTGVAHILEHTCLQGCEGFPMNNVFFNLFKKTLCTFLNANTYPFMTSYPHASENKKDFFNVMAVTTNSMFFPLLTRENFMQEGWRYEFAELDNPESDLTFKGIVFNEMKGAMGDEEHIFEFTTMRHLYPDTPFAENYGGDPKNIPDLTYEEFKGFHKDFYHPSNAIFFTYGDIPASEHQEKFEEFVLNKFTFKEIDARYKDALPFKAPKKVKDFYALNQEDSYKNNYYIKSWDICDVADVEDAFTLDFMQSLLAGDSSSVLKAAIDDSNLVEKSDLLSESTGKRFFYAIICQGVKEEDIPALDKIIEDTLKQIAKDGFDEDTIKKDLHQFEIEAKQKDGGRMSYGLNNIYKIVENALAGVDSISLLDMDIALDKLKESFKDENFLKDFVNKHFVENIQRVDIDLKASQELNKKETQAELDRLAKVKASLTDEQKQKIIKDCQSLLELQNSEPDMSILPEFSTKDIPEELNIEKLQKQEFKGQDVYAFAAPTSGLTNIQKSGFLKDIKISDLPYINLFVMLANFVGFNGYSYKESDKIKKSISSGIDFMTNVTADVNQKDKYSIQLNVTSCLLHENADKVAPLMDEVVNNIRLDEKDFIKQKVKEYALKVKNNYTTMGHLTAIELVGSKLSKGYLINYHSTGLHFVKFLQDLAQNIDNDKAYDELISKLENIRIKAKEAYANSAVFIADLEENLPKDLESFAQNAKTTPERYYIEQDIDTVEEDICLSNADVNYVSAGFKTVDFDHKLSGAARVLGCLIKINYTTPEIREKGGAYGGFAAYNPRFALMVFASYRDPSLSKTMEVYKNLDKWLKDESNFTEEKLEQGILKSIAEFDRPEVKVEQCRGAFNRFLGNETDERIKDFRTKILKTSTEQIKVLIEEYFLPEMKNMSMCAIASKNSYNKEGLNLKTIEI